MSSNDRKQIRNAFNLLKDNDESIHLKDYLITMCPNITETKFDDEDILKNNPKPFRNLPPSFFPSISSPVLSRMSSVQEAMTM